MQLSDDQQLVLNSLLAWFKSESSPQVITMGGYAGTGKTTLLARLRKEIHEIRPELKVNFCSFTGKAVLMMKSVLENSNSIKSTDSVTTIHSLIYSPIEDEHDRIIGWEKREEIDGGLIIVDEASMIDETIWSDLRSYGVRIIAVGDHGQLPPIHGRFNLMEDPELKLEKIHRQAEENPIIKLSIIARERGKLPEIPFSRTVQVMPRNNPEVQEDIKEIIESYDDDTMVLCGYNNTRVKLNKFIRSVLEFDPENPQKGDTVICLRNNHKEGIYNGMLGKIVAIYPENSKKYFAEILMSDGKTFTGPILKEQFNNPQSLNHTDDRRKTLDVDLFDYGYALTVHKAQGSQARRVILFSERFKSMDDDMWRRWLYTGITRAQEELYVLA